MPLILGIDPGSRITGYGVIEANGSKTLYVASGCIRITAESLAERLQQVFSGITSVINLHNPQQVAIERIFMAKNADSALKLGQARGVAIVAAANQGLEVAEYAARTVKQAIVGRGAAEKAQVQHMVASILQLDQLPPTDASDALAIALCHAHTQQGLIRTAGSRSRRTVRFRLEDLKR